MDNYFQRDLDGIWWVTLETGTKVRCSFSGSMEWSYQQGILEGLKRNIHIQIAESHLTDSEKKLMESKLMNDCLEKYNKETPLYAASESLNTTPIGELGL
jgi:hypothetical protein